jgi:hypothetical protein
MTRRSHLVIAAAVALCASPTTLAVGRGSTIHDSASVNCGGSGVNSLYCIPQQSVFTFKHIGKAAGCSILVSFTVEPKIEGLSGHVHIGLKAIDHQRHSLERTARPLITGGSSSYRFKKLSAGNYQLSGWYEGDGTRLASTHRTKRFALHCG